MDIQSIYASTKTAPSAGSATEDDTAAPAAGFAALLELVGSQVKATLGLGTMDPTVLKSEPAAEPARAPETKPRAERADERDAKAKPAKDDSETDETTDETVAADDQDAAATDTNTQDQAAQQQAAQVAVAPATDIAAVTGTETAAPVVVTEAVVETAAETVATETDVVVADAVATEKGPKNAETVIDPKAVAQAEVKAGEKVVAPEAVVKDTARVQQAINAYAPAQETTEAEIAPVEAEATTAETKTAAKDSAVRTVDVRSAAAQEQANSLARLLGSENRIQVQVNVNTAQTAKQSVADVSIYNIYSGYTAADAVSLANGQFGLADEGNSPTLSTAPAPAPRAEAPAPAAVIAQAIQAAPLPQTNGGQTATTASTTPARAEGVSPVAVQASASSGGASNTSLGFSTFANSGASNTTQQTQQAAQPNPTERPAATAQHVIDQIKVNITKAAKAGLDRVTIQLKPVELGRIEIKLEMSDDHKVRVTVTADNKDTLNLLQNDSRTLERALNDAGLRTDANNLHFNLRSETDPRSADGQNGHGHGRNGANTQADNAETAEPIYDYGAAAFARGGVDTFA